MDIHIELQDTDARFSLFASSTYELAFGGLSVHMNADQFQQLCDNLRHWVVEDTTPQPSADAVRELVKRWRGSGKAIAHICADELESLLSGGSHA